MAEKMNGSTKPRAGQVELDWVLKVRYEDSVVVRMKDIEAKACTLGYVQNYAAGVGSQGFFLDDENGVRVYIPAHRVVDVRIEVVKHESPPTTN